MPADIPESDPHAAPAGDAMDQALHWFVVLSSGEVSAQEQSDFDRWLAADPSHSRHWASVLAFQSALRNVPEPAAGQALRSAAVPAKARLSRRRVLAITGATTLAVLCFGGRKELAVLSAGLRTGVGEQREAMLPDGSRMVMDTDSAVDIRFEEGMRRVVLLRGAIMLETAHADAWRDQPVVVDTSQGRVQALGTRFVVRRAKEEGLLDSQGLSRVEVLQGAVRVRPHGVSGEGFTLTAGQQADFDLDRVSDVAQLDPNAQAWIDGMLVVRDRPLAEVAQELARYRHGVVRVDDDVADIRVTGVFPLGDSDRVLAALERAFPVRAERRTRYWISLTRAPEKKSAQP